MLKCLLAPAAFLYKAGVTFRHRLFDWGILKSEKFDIPIICIGNITVGGTGKTPMAEMVIAYMSQMHNVALLSRGYGRRTKGYLEVRADSHYRDAGDEPLQIKLKFPDTVVAVCEKRSEGIRRICAEHPEVDLIVMDDGFQHRYVEPKINIVMIDATRPVQHDRMLPVGTLRDLPEELHRAHYFVVTKCPERMAPIDRRILRKVLIQVAYQRVYFTRFESFMPQPLYAEEASGEPLAQGRPVIALSGIGNPKPFVQTLRERYEVVAEMTLDDHGELQFRALKEELKDILALELKLPAVDLIRCGGGDLLAAQREQWNDGSNTLCIAPGRVITYDRNYVTNELLDKKGIDVISISSAELSRGRGGPRCMSCPVNRDDL